MNKPIFGGAETSTLGNAEVISSVNLEGDDANITTAFPKLKPLLQESLNNGHKNEQFLVCIFLYKTVDLVLAKQVYEETRLVQRVCDFNTTGFNIDRQYSRTNNMGRPKVSYFLTDSSIKIAQTRINQLRQVRGAKPIDWEVVA